MLCKFKARQILISFQIDMNKPANELPIKPTGPTAQTAFSALLSESTDGAVVWSSIRDASGRIVDFKATVFNQAALLNISGDSFRASTFNVLFPDAASAFDQYVQVVETGQPFRSTRPFSANSITYWYDVSATKFDDGLLVIFKDVTDRIQTNLQVENQANLLQQVFNASIFSINLYEAIRDDLGTIIDFRITLCNEAARRLALENYGYDTTGHTWLSVLPIGRHSVLFQDKVKVVESGQPLRVTRYYANIDRWFDSSMVKLNDGLVATFLDVTEHKRLTERLERSNQSLEQFAYVAAHDLQEPLRKVQSFSELLSNQYKAILDDNGLDLLYRMHSATKRMQELIRDVLTYSRLSSQQVSPKVVNLNTLIADICTDLDTTIREKSAVITIHPLPVILGDSTQIRQLFYNLLSNSLKFTQKTPQITFDASRITGTQLPNELMLASNREYAVISITDNGIGFDEQYRERIFLPFQRLHGRKQYAGSGIGLAICKRVVENHNGGMSVQSQPGQGTTFTVYLPVKK